MHTFQISVVYAALAGLVSAQPMAHPFDFDAEFRAPVAGDVRTPCPMLNALSNHGIVNRNGYNMTRDQIVPALMEVAGFDEDISNFLFEAGMSTTDNPNGTSFDYNDVNQHNILEHDGSLSRSDFYFGDAVSFSPEAFAQTKSFFTEDIIDLQQAGNAHVSRMDTMNTTNPNFTLTDTGNFNSIGETIIYMAVLGSKDKYEVDRARVEYFFEQDRFPTALGWKPEPQAITTDFVVNGLRELVNITGRDVPFPDEAEGVGNEKRSLIGRRRVAHFGSKFFF